MVGSQASSVVGALDRTDGAPTRAEAATGTPLVSRPPIWLEGPDASARRDPSRGGVAAPGARRSRLPKSRTDLRVHHDVSLLRTADTSACRLDDRGPPPPEGRAISP